MVFLTMDTATEVLCLGLGDETGKMLAAWTSVAPKMHATLLHPLLDEMLAAVGLEIGDLHGIMVGVGPGSYTGVRIAVTAAKVLAYTLNIPVVPVSSLEAAAYAAHLHHGLVVVAWDARRHAVYSAAYRSDPVHGGWSMALPEMRRDYSLLAEEIQAILKAEEPVVVLGNGATQLIELLNQKGNDRTVGVYEQYTQLTGESILQVGLLRGYAGVGVHGLVPNYLQLAEAQARLVK